MLKSKIVILFSSFILFNACSFISKNNNLEKDFKNPSSHLKRADLTFEQGKKILLNGHIKESEYYFDRTINILLDSNSMELTNKEYLDYYIKEISEIELNYLKSKDTTNSNQQKAFLDEVISTPLFNLSEKEISQFKKKMDEKHPNYTIPVVVNSKVISFLKAFQNIKHESIQRALCRSQEYIEKFKKIFRENKVPEDLAYLPIIESGFRVKAVSRARAKGIWQFMASTARMFGLRVDWVIDERLDPIKSTYAAAEYLKSLFDEYGDWYIALACYNGGTRRVNRAIRRLKTKDFFSIARSKYIKRETKNYVPAFLASLIIVKSPEEYGFNLDLTYPTENTKIIKIPSPIDLNAVSLKSKISYTKLKELNPELIRDFTPFDKKYYYLRVPESVDEASILELKRLPPQKKYFVGWYKVRRGDSLYAIARKFGTSVKKIKKVNKLRSNLIRPGKQLLIPRGRI